MSRHACTLSRCFVIHGVQDEKRPTPSWLLYLNLLSRVLQVGVRGDRRLHSSAADTRSKTSRSDENTRPSPRHDTADKSSKRKHVRARGLAHDRSIFRSGEAAFSQHKDASGAGAASPRTPAKVGHEPQPQHYKRPASLLAQVQYQLLHNTPRALTCTPGRIEATRPRSCRLQREPSMA